MVSIAEHTAPNPPILFVCLEKGRTYCNYAFLVHPLGSGPARGTAVIFYWLRGGTDCILDPPLLDIRDTDRRTRCDSSYRAAARMRIERF